ncbi:hypothetical protein H0H81_000240 [Sphagnurus paluster]|uniref:Uncharacterized protein n=1 Tax=Sphagnurus paluster TaxID=117069 RepID=A0A9P7KI57_9AGAR|nr:hypothetical protein H0H81_000240 [Sphagnurus paluster]
MLNSGARLALGIILCGFLYLLTSSAPWSSPSQPKPVYNLKFGSDIENGTQPVTKPNPPDNFCSPANCAAGRWEPRNPPFTSLKDFQAAYANRLDRLWKGCRAIPDPTGQRPAAAQGKVDEERLMQVMNWTWTPYAGELKPWDPEDFMVRLLRSPGGLILIGDSITQQHYHALGYLLNQAGLDFDRNLPHLPMHDHKNVRQLLLKPKDPLTRKVLTRAGVPESRLQRPVVTMLEDHMLIGQRDIRAITEKLGASKSYYWYHDHQRVPGWEEYLAEAAKPRPGEEESVTEDTIFLMNAGAHWSRHELAMLPPRATDKEEQARVKESYKQMMKLIIGRIGSIERLTIFYRSTAPGHPACEKSANPYENSAIAREAEKNIVPRLHALVDTDDLKRQRSRWDWDLFEVHNELWRRMVDSLMRNREWRKSRAVRALGAKWYYLDLWDVNLQRPDAHSEPGVDCLHCE